MPLDVGAEAPAFRLRGIDNVYWILGKPDRRRCVVVAFFRRDSRASRVLVPFIERLHRKGRAAHAEILGVSMDNMRDTIEFAEDYALTFPILLDEDPPGDVARAWGVTGVPTVFLLDERLRVAQATVGWSKADYATLAGAYVTQARATDLRVWEDRDLPPETMDADPIR